MLEPRQAVCDESNMVKACWMLETNRKTDASHKLSFLSPSLCPPFPATTYMYKHRNTLSLLYFTKASVISQQPAPQALMSRVGTPDIKDKCFKIYSSLKELGVCVCTLNQRHSARPQEPPPPPTSPRLPPRWKKISASSFPSIPLLLGFP